ncbi:MAG: DnaA ATPase domain-containing protein [Phycisphaerales bacterium JB063]
MKAIAARVAQHVEQTLGQQKYATWFGHSARFQFEDEDQTLVIAVPNRFLADGITKRFRSTLEDALHQEAAQAALAIRVQPEPCHTAGPSTDDPATAAGQAVTRPAPARVATARPVAAPRKKPAGSAYRHRLDRFIDGPSNKLALAAAKRLADLDDPTASHPLFLHGICGVGKTHLLQGICNATLALRPDAKVVYLTGEQFANQYITAVRQGKLDAFRKHIRRLDLLAIDDIQFIASREKTQQEFLHCFEENELGGARVVLASDHHPRDIEMFSDALVSRCVRGLVVEMTEPDPVTRKAIIAELAHRRGLVLQPAVIDLLAERYDGSVREIEGALAKLHALASLTDQPERRSPAQLINVSRALLEQLPELAQPKVRRPVKFTEITRVVCDRLMLEPVQLTGSSRNKQVVLARSLVVHLARELTPMSYPEIAHAMGRKTHSTVITACQRMTRLLEADAPLLLPGGAGQTTPSTLAASLRRELLRAG